MPSPCVDGGRDWVWRGFSSRHPGHRAAPFAVLPRAADGADTHVLHRARRKVRQHHVLGVRIDARLLPPPYFQTNELWEQTWGGQGQVETNAAAFEPAAYEGTAAQRLGAALKRLPFKNAAGWTGNKRRLYLPLLRWQLAKSPKPTVFLEQPAVIPKPPTVMPGQPTVF